MKNETHGHLNNLYERLESEMLELSKIRVKSFKCNNYELANEVNIIEESIRNVSNSINRYFQGLQVSEFNNGGNRFLKGNVD